MRNFILAALLFPAAACATAPVDAPPAAGGATVCRQGSTDRFVGQRATPQLGTEMLAESGARRIRWVPFGSMVTMDYSPERLTVQLDEQNRVLSAKCG